MLCIMMDRNRQSRDVIVFDYHLKLLIVLGFGFLNYVR